MNIALILAGGLGARLGGEIPKQYIEIRNKPIITYCLETFEKHQDIDFIQIVADEVWHNFVLQQVKEKFKGFSRPGNNRQLSILNGLEDIRQYAEEGDTIIIHDAARPLVSQEMIANCVATCQQYNGVIPVLPMKDTIYFGQNQRITKLIPREGVFIGQAPEAFKLGVYLEANKRLLPDEILKINGSTEPAILAGMDIKLIKGDEQIF